MTSHPRKLLPVRNPESGAVVVLVGILWTTLFGLAALAIDIGYLYQSQRGLQAAADAAVMAGLPQLSTSPTTASSNARAMATANGYTNGAGGVTVSVSTTSSPTTSTLTVQIMAPQPTFFAGIFGVHSKSLTVSAAGQTAASAPGIYALDTNCADLGLKFNGGPTTVTGGVESAGTLGFYTGPGATVNGPATSACAGVPHYIGGVDTFNGGPPAGGTPPTTGDPFGYTIAADFPVSKCSFGTNFSNVTPLNANSIPGIWPLGQGPATGTLNSGIICSGSDIQLNGASITGTVTLVAYGTIEVSGTDISLTAAPGGDNLVAFSESNSGSTNNCTSPANAIQMGSSTWTLNGSLYAPNGCISAGGGGSNFNVNGSIIGYEVNTAFGGTVDSGGGGGGGAYYLYQ